MADSQPHPLMPRLKFEANTPIFREGDAGDRAYVVEAGEVAIVRTVDGKPEVLGTIGKGGMFGEMALVDGEPRMAAAIATKETTCFVITRDVLLKKLEGADPFVKALTRVLVRSVRARWRQKPESGGAPVLSADSSRGW
jgi:CRP/FNR family transcriptional regulator, cyclic AMP receptor protein